MTQAKKDPIGHASGSDAPRQPDAPIRTGNAHRSGPNTLHAKPGARLKDKGAARGSTDNKSAESAQSGGPGNADMPVKAALNRRG